MNYTLLNIVLWMAMVVLGGIIIENVVKGLFMTFSAISDAIDSARQEKRRIEPPRITTIKRPPISKAVQDQQDFISGDRRENVRS